MKKQYSDQYKEQIIIIDQVKNENWRWYVTVYYPNGVFNCSFGSNKYFARSVLREAQDRIDEAQP